MGSLRCSRIVVEVAEAAAVVVAAVELTVAEKAAVDLVVKVAVAMVAAADAKVDVLRGTTFKAELFLPVTSSLKAE